LSYRKQINTFTCGAASIRNAIYFLSGKSKDIRRIAKEAGTNKFTGTSEAGILRALKKLGFKGTIIRSKTEEAFKNKVLRKLKKGIPCIVLIDDERHWVCALKFENREVVFAEPDREMKKPVYKFPLLEFLIRGRNIDLENPKVKPYYEFVTVEVLS
jgi:ABC-type bacteriocin/lantibiotic exporter with double-glycine peptidase domain